MASGGRSRNAPCFCGSGRKLKHCCLRSLRPVRTWRSAEGRCRWRFWQPHAGRERHAGEVAEHLCSGERVWIARGTDAGTSWLIDADPVTLLEVLDHLPGALYGWVIEQTITALEQGAPADEGAAPISSADAGPDEVLIDSEIRQLMLEILRLAHASDALAAHLRLNPETDEPAGLELRDRALMRIAS